MNVLIMGLPFGVGPALLPLYQSKRGHDIRFLAGEGEADFHFSAIETCEEVIARVAETWQPDLLLCWCPEMFPPPHQVENCPIKTAAIISDWNIYYPVLQYNLSRFDMVLMDKLGADCVHFPGARTAYFQPVYSQLSSVQHADGPERDLDIVFVGNMNPAVHVARGRNLERIATLADRYRVEITSGPIEGAYADLLRRGRIVFNQSVRREMNLRCFEAPACGALLFLEEDNLEAQKYIVDGEHAVYYDDANLLEKLVYYLEHEDERARIAAQGHTRIQSLAGEQRLDEFFDWFAGQPVGVRAYKNLSEEMQWLATCRQYSAGLVAEQTEWLRQNIEAIMARFPKQPAFAVTAAAVASRGLAELSLPEKRAQAKRVIVYLHRAAELAPDSAVLWLNLAYVAFLSEATSLERRCLMQCLDATSLDHAEQLLGPLNEQGTIAWRRATALGEARIESIWAMAATRLVIILLKDGDWDQAAGFAHRAIDWEPHFAAPYHVCAQALVGLGNAEGAAHMMERGLAYSVFDAQYRLDLIQLRLAVGREDDARALARASAELFETIPVLDVPTNEFDALVSG
jgi:hypothetical protein